MSQQLLIVGLLVLVNAAFAGTEMAMVSLRDRQLDRLETSGPTGALLVGLARQPNRYLATIQIGITLAGFLASASAAVSLAGPVEDALAPTVGRHAPLVAVVAVTSVLAYLNLVFGELVPKRIAMGHAERWALIAARPLAAVSAAARPAVWVLSASTALVVRLLRASGNPGEEELSAGELRELVADQSGLSDAHRRILDGAFDLSDRRIVDVFRPRPEVVVLDASTACSAALADMLASGHSRAPVAPGGRLDDVVGVVHLRDLVMGGDSTVASVAGELTVVPEMAPAIVAIHQMQLAHAQLAVVVNEHGGAEGIVTIEDILEELVGEIYDETDRDVATVQHLPDGSVVIPGRFPAHDLVDIGVIVAPGAYATAAGYVLSRLQHVPTGPGDVVTDEHQTWEVLSVSRHAITELRLTPHREPVAVDPAPTGDDETEA